MMIGLAESVGIQVEQIVTCCHDQSIKIWNEEGKLLHTIENAHDYWIESVGIQVEPNL